MTQDRNATSRAPAAPSTRKRAPNSRKAFTRPATNLGSAAGAATVTNPAIAKHSAATKAATNSGSLGDRSRTISSGATSEKTLSTPAGRAQTTLPAVAVALVLLTVVTALGLFVADSAIVGADRTPGERRVAAATAAQLVAADGPLSVRANVLNQSAVTEFDAAALQNLTGPGYATTVALDGETVAATDDGAGGTTIRRLVLVESTTAQRLEPDGTSVTLPRRARNVTLTLSPPDGTTVSTVRANDRVLLHNESGLTGSFEVGLSGYETTELRFQTAGTLHDGAIVVEYEAPATTKATLAVTVDA